MSIPSFRIFNPQQVPSTPATVELFFHEAQENAFRAGSDAFVVQLLRDAGVEAPTVVRWSTVRYRARYFSASPWAETTWQERWPVTFRLRVELAAPAVFRPDEGDGAYESEALDESAAAPDGASDPDARCLVLADFADSAALERARAAVVGDHGEGVATAARAMGRLSQLQIDLGMRDAAFYAGGAVEAEELAARCRALGATVHLFDSALRLFAP